MRKKLLLVLALLLMTLAARGQYFTGFSVESYRITSAWPTSLRSVRGNVQAVIGNTGQTRRLSDVEAIVYRNGRRFVVGTGEDTTFMKGRGTYVLKGRATLADGVSTWDAIRAAFNFNANEYTIDFNVTITYPDGHRDYVTRRGIPLVHYLRR